MYKQIVAFINKLFMSLGLGMRAKLIILFIAIKVIPLILLAYVAWQQSWSLGDYLKSRTLVLNESVQTSLMQAGEIAIADAVTALDNRAREDIESLTTNTARQVANFLYQRDDDVRFAASLPPNREIYKNFVDNKSGLVIVPGAWELTEDGKAWQPAGSAPSQAKITSSIEANNENFNYRAPDQLKYASKPLFLEMTFVDLAGKEQIKVTTSPLMDPALKDVSVRANTFVRAETYFAELGKLKPGEIYVSEVIGAYTPSKVISFYTPQSAAAAGEDYAPQQSAYAGRENPSGKRFQGIVRWATPVEQNGKITGYVTLALNHDHIMEFTDHLMPTPNRYTELPDASAGNYAFIWDYKGRSIVHPRHHSIVGYDQETGDPQIPWLEDWIYEAWKASGKTYAEFITDVPTFQDQSTARKPARELTQAGLLGLDCRYLNFAPQCTGWFDLTREGGSGSFRILWSSLWKLTTAAAIPYYTGRYGDSLRGFGFVAIGAGVDDFHRPAMQTKDTIDEIIETAHNNLDSVVAETEQGIARSLWNTAVSLSVATAMMVALVIFIAIWLASILTRKITSLIQGISRFRGGERNFRFHTPLKDEMGLLADSFDDMADSIVDSVQNPLAIVDNQRNIIYMNDAYLCKYNITLEEIKGKYYFDYSAFTEGGPSCPITAFLEHREAEVIFDSRSNIYYKGQAIPFTSLDGQTGGYIISVSDVSEIILSQKQIEQQGALLNTIFTALPDLIWYKDESGKIMAANPRFLALLGKKEEDVIGKNAGELNLPPELLEIINKQDQTIIETGQAFKAEEYMTFADGHMETVESVRIPIYAAQDKLLGILGVARDITQRVRIENELRQAQDELKVAIKKANKANDSKSAFLASMSHEIRTPMNAIIGMTSIVKRKLGEKDIPWEEIRVHMDQVDTSSQHLLSLLNDILDISKIEAGKIEISREPFILATLIDNVASIIKPRCIEKNISFKVMQEGVGDHAFNSDSLRLRQVLINLLGNSVKFTPSAGTVSFSVTVREKKENQALVCFQVSDTGIGISPEALQKLFVAFEQGGASVAREYGGTGLGLSISKSIINLFGGDITVTSRQGEGSLFEFSIWMDYADNLSTPQNMRASLPTFAGYRALLVDDVRINRIIVLEQLKKTNLIIEEADDGDTAVEKFSASPIGFYNIIFMDVQMPRMNGYEASKAIRALDRPDAATVIIVAMTANAFREDVEEALRSGMNDHLAKPLQLNKLVDTLVKYLNSYQAGN
ncbi:MAG: PAS domain-containing protein [Desulfarculales bacterium]|jgi:PAS domain S-box-containing protein|nr:PAS domain-containing protein [Desulfarculales bacterium]